MPGLISSDDNYASQVGIADYRDAPGYHEAFQQGLAIQQGRAVAPVASNAPTAAIVLVGVLALAWYLMK